VSFIVPFPGGGAVRRVFKYAAISNPAAVSVDFASVPLDEFAGNAQICVGVTARHSSESAQISGVSVAGSPASEIVGAIAADFYKVKLFSVAHPAVSSGTVTVTGSGPLLLVGISVYTLYGGAVHDTASSGVQTNPQSVSIDVPALGAAIAVGVNSSTSNSWSGLSEDTDSNLSGSGTSINHTSASAEFTTQQSNLSVSRTMGVTSFPAMVAVSFAP